MPAPARAQRSRGESVTAIARHLKIGVGLVPVNMLGWVLVVHGERAGVRAGG